MPMLTVYVDERAMRSLEAFSRESGRSVEELVSAAIESEALRARPLTTQELDEAWGD